MRVRQLGPTGDYLFGQGQKNFLINSPACVGQVVKTTLLLWQGEWFLDSTVGTPYLTGILGKHSQLQADVTSQDVVLAVQGVTTIQSFQSTDDSVNRAYSVEMTVNTVYGPTPVEIQNYINY